MSIYHSKYDLLNSTKRQPLEWQHCYESVHVRLIELQGQQKPFGWTKKKKKVKGKKERKKGKVEWQTGVVRLCSSRSFPLPNRKLAMQPHSAAPCLFIALTLIMFVLLSPCSLSASVPLLPTVTTVTNIFADFPLHPSSILSALSSNYHVFSPLLRPHWAFHRLDNNGIS